MLVVEKIAHLIVIIMNHSAVGELKVLYCYNSRMRNGTTCVLFDTKIVIVIVIIWISCAYDLSPAKDDDSELFVSVNIYYLCTIHADISCRVYYIIFHTHTII